MGEITLSQERYDDLIELEARVDVIVTLIARNGYISKDNLLDFIGTPHAMEVLAKFEEKAINIPCLGGLADDIDD